MFQAVLEVKAKADLRLLAVVEFANATSRLNAEYFVEHAATNRDARHWTRILSEFYPGAMIVATVRKL